MLVIRRFTLGNARPARSLVYLLSLVLLTSLLARNARAQAQGLHGGYMQLSDIADGTGSIIFGPGQTVAVDGVMPFTYVCQSMSDTNKFPKPEFQFFPASDFYVIPDTGTPLQYGAKLQDINGTPNTVIGLSDGSFVDEIVAITKPAGNTGAGKYSIVMDVCQTGVWDPLGGDMILGDASQAGFIVQEPASLPPLDLSPVKTNAAAYADTLSGLTINLPFGQSVTSPGFCALYGKLTQHAPAASALAGWFQSAGAYCTDLIGEYKGLAADPTDPNYMVFAELGNIGYANYTAGTPLERAARTLANALADQDATTNAFLNSIQKFQGAQLAGDDEWSMLQLMQMQKFINLLVGNGGSMLRTYAALEVLNIALQQDTIGTSQDAQNLEAFIPTMQQTLGAMLSPLDDFFMPYFDGTGTKQLRPVGLLAFIQVYLGLSGDPVNLPGIPQERAIAGLPPIVLPYPTATTGGNYNAAPGEAVTFNASQSTDPGGAALTYAWDLNGNGTFADAAGAQPQYTYSQPETHIIAVRATDPAGNTNVAYGLATIGDVNSQDIIVASGNDQLFDVHPDGSYTQLTTGVGYADTGLKRLQVDVKGDIWVLDSYVGIEHFDSTGNLLATITSAQVAALTGIPLQGIADFAIDGRGNIDLVAAQDLGIGYWNYGYGEIPEDLPGISKLFRVAPDASSATYLDDLNTPYLSLATVSGILTEYVDPASGCFGNPGFVRVDPNTGNIIVSNVNNTIGNVGSTAGCSSGVLSINPTTAAISITIPPYACDGAGCQPQTIPPFGTFTANDLTFGGSTLHEGTYGGIAPQAARVFVLDAQGNYLIFPIQADSFLGRVDVPPQIINNNGILDINTFPVMAQNLGSPLLIFNALTVDAGGDYVGVGINFAVSFAPLMYRIQPDGEVFSINTTLSPAFGFLLVDVVPQIRAVTPSDMPAPPAITLSNFTVGQTSCPGSAQLTVTVQNPGSTPTTTPVQVVFFDGDPGLGLAIGTATTTGVLAAGGSVSLSAPWATPSPGTHSLFALALGANTVNAEFQVCVPSQFTANPLLLSPATGSNAIGTSYSTSAQLVDIFGDGISGVPITFSVTGANTATGTVTTNANGNAVFTYTGINSGQDSIVATEHNVTSNTVAETWASSAAPPVVTPPASISIPATQAGGATGGAWPALAAFLAGGTATSTLSTAPVELPPQVGGVSVSNATLFPIGTTAVTFSFKDANGNIGSATSSVTVAVGTPRITGSITGIGTDPASGAVYANVVLTNTGTGNAYNLTISTLTFRTLAGTGAVTYNTSLSPALPIVIGNLNVSVAVTTRVYLNVPSTATRIALTENGGLQDVLGTNYTFSTSEAAIP